nr:polysaccharide biosynthesis tyrosine autokinase [Desulfobulbaceae bacterium]
MGKVFKALNKFKGVSPEIDSAAETSLQNKTEEEFEASSSVQPSNKVEQQLHSTPKSVAPQTKTVPSGQWDEKLLTFSEPGSVFSENIRKLRTRILHPGTAEPFKKILVTSALPGAGKSFTCANLGIAIAQGLEHHALLVDCDLRRPNLAAWFGVASQDGRGLVNYLRDDEDLGDLIMKTGMEKLSIIPGGTPPPNPAEVLGTTRVGQMFAQLENRYDDRFIIIDTPPAMLANEVFVLARHADAVVVVVRWGGGGKEQVKQLVDSIGREKLIGVVFNGYQTNFFSTQLSGYNEYAQYSYK